MLDLAVDRGAFICQSQSLNVHLQSPTLGQLTSMHFYGWKKGLKTGMYYLRTRPAAQAIQFTVDQGVLNSAKQLTANAITAMAQKPSLVALCLRILLLPQQQGYKSRRSPSPGTLPSSVEIR